MEFNYPANMTPAVRKWLNRAFAQVRSCFNRENPDAQRAPRDVFKERADTREKLSKTANQLKRIRLGTVLRGWGAETDADFLLFTIAIGGALGGYRDCERAVVMATGGMAEGLLMKARARHFQEYMSPDYVLHPDRLMTLVGLESPSEDTTFAVRTDPQRGLSTLVVSDSVSSSLQTLVSRLRFGDKVLNDWGYSATHRSSVGGVALFHGPPGCGKTLAAEVIAYELGLPLFSVKTSRVVSRWVGDAEKRMVSLFEEVSRQPSLLFWDEADGFLSKRTEVNCSSDAFRNNEVTVLMRLLETRTDPSILATNHADVLDPALESRLSMKLEIPMPERAQRIELWKAHIGADAPIEDEIDVDALSRPSLSGRDIAQVALDAAFRAAASGRGLRQRDFEEALNARATENVSTIGFMRAESIR